LDTFNSEKDPHILAAVLKTLSKLHVFDNQVEKTIIAALDHKELLVAMEAARAIGDLDIKEESVITRLKELKESEDGGE